jgi:F-type H+-transporting ATPase subunit a
MSQGELAIEPWFRIGPLEITNTIVTTWIIMAALAAAAWLLTRRLRLEPGPLQTAVEGIVAVIADTVEEVAGEDGRRLMPFIATLWIFLVVANLTGLLPGASSPTRDLAATAALAVLVFLSTHWYGVRIEGAKRYVKHYLEPSPLLLPFNLLGEITRTVALAVRLFGNMMSLEMAAILILLVAGFLAPVPILMLHVVEALVQAYIFGMLALIYVAGGIQSQRRKATTRNNEE